MIKTELLKYVAEVEAAHAAHMEKFLKGIADGHILHTLQWQTVGIATAIHENAKAQILKATVAKYENDDLGLVKRLKELHESLTRTLIVNARGHHSTNPVSNEIDQAETHATAMVLEKIDAILRYDADVKHATEDAKLKALNVIALDPKIAKWLHKNDPKALEQVNEARNLA